MCFTTAVYIILRLSVILGLDLLGLALPRPQVTCLFKTLSGNATAHKAAMNKAAIRPGPPGESTLLYILSHTTPHTKPHNHNKSREV
jgi:hypothetical protein